MNDSRVPRFGQLAEKLVANGYDVLPLPYGKKKPFLADWPNYQFSEKDSSQCRQCGTGILAKNTPAIDIDVLDERIASEIDAMVIGKIGKGPVRIGHAPKLLRPCRLEGAPFDKIKTHTYQLSGDWTGDPKYKGHAVEILANGQQFVAYNIHQDTNRPYHWNGGGDLLTVSIGELPSLTQETARVIIAEAEKILAKYGTPIGKLVRQESKRGHKPNEVLRAENPKLLRDALAHIENNELHYDDWGKVGLAIKGSLGDDGYDDWVAFSEKSNKYDVEKTKTQWQQFHPNSIGAGSILYWAREAGWQPPEADGEYEGMEQDVADVLKDLDPRSVVLPNDHVPFPWAARRLFTAMGRGRELYSRGGVVVELRGSVLNVLTPAEFRSRIDRGRRVRAVTLHKGKPLLQQKRCSADTAAALLTTREAIECLPPIELVSKASVLIEHDGQLLTLGPGYHPEGGGVLVLSGQAPEEVPLKTAVSALLALTEQFKFTSEADRARAIAGFIGPVLRSGALLPGHALMSCVEADESQTGKGYLLALQQAVFGEVPDFIAQKVGGVGSLDEDLQSKLIGGKPFIAFDNIRGHMSSTYLEAVLTAYGEVPARVPHRPSVPVSVRRMIFQLSSNGIAASRDLSKRMLITRLLHQPPGYVFKPFPGEGGLLEHVKGRQAFYLGTVHSVVRYWHQSGRQEIASRHSFREWCGVLDWIGQKVFGLPPLLEGHDESIQRVANPALGWLREVSLVVVTKGRAGHCLSATTIIQVCSDNDIQVPGTGPEMADDKLKLHVGRLLSRCFREGDRLLLDTVHVKRWEVPSRDPRYRDRTLKSYQFWRGDDPPPPTVVDEGGRDEIVDA